MAVSLTPSRPLFSARAISSLFLLGIILCLYYRVTDFPFTNWDDIEFIRDNPTLRSANFVNIKRIMTPGGVPGEKLYIPVTYLSYLIENVIFGLKPGVIHINNLALHLFNTLLVFSFFYYAVSNKPAAVLGAIAFAIHPLMVEAVVWPMGRKDLLSTFLGLTALFSYFQALTKSGKTWYSISLTAFFLGLLAKPTLLMLPALLPLIDRSVGFRQTRGHWYFKLPYLALSLVVFTINLAMPTDQPNNIPAFANRLTYLPWIIWGWELRFLLVQQPSPFYCWPANYDLTAIAVSTVVFILTFVIIGFCAATKKFRGLTFGFLFTIIASAPALSLVITPRDFVTADRYGYFPLIGVFYSITVFLTVISDRLRKFFFALTACWLTAATLITDRQIDVWQDSVSLWSRASEACKYNEVIYNNLGMAYIDLGQTDKATTQFQRGIRIFPNYAPLYNNLGRLYLDQKQPTEAKKIFERALSFVPNNAAILKNLGDSCTQLGQISQAVTLYKKSILRKPDDPAAYISLGNCLLGNGQLKEAEKVYERALEIDSKNPDLYFNLGILYEKDGRSNQAIAVYEQAISYNPNFYAAHYNLANLYSSKNNIVLAEQEYLQVLKSESLRLQAAINLGNLCLNSGRRNEAISYYQQAIQWGGNKNPIPHYNLGLIYEQKEALSDALSEYKKALKIQPDFGHAHYELAKIYFQLNAVENTKIHLEKAMSLGIKVDQDFLGKLANTPNLDSSQQ